MDNYSELEIWYQNLRKFKKDGVFAPHKILTILYALSSIYKNKKIISYKDDRKNLEDIISELTHKKSNCLYPIVRLTNDNEKIWKTIPQVLPLNSSGDLNIKDALDLDLKAGFSDEVYEFLNKNRATLQKFIFEIIDDNFPETLHEYLIQSLELENINVSVVTPEIKQIIVNKRFRDPKFPQKILALYDNRCAFCELKIYFHSKPVSIEAAHIKWNAYGGECTENNGIALCPTHHLTLDKGIWAINHNFEIILSPHVIIDEKTDKLFKPFNGKSVLKNIVDTKLKPIESNIDWHLKNIFNN